MKKTYRLNEERLSIHIVEVYRSFEKTHCLVTPFYNIIQLLILNSPYIFTITLPNLSLETLEEKVIETLPSWVACDLSTGSVDQVPIDFSTTSINVNLGGSQPALALPEVAADPEDYNDREGEVGLEECFSRTDAVDTKR
jgi:hypothetical protein